MVTYMHFVQTYIILGIQEKTILQVLGYQILQTSYTKWLPSNSVYTYTQQLIPIFFIVKRVYLT